MSGGKRKETPDRKTKELPRGSVRGSIPHLVTEVAQAAVALCGSVELCDLRDVEAGHELLPYGLPQAVAQCHAHSVLLLGVPDRLVQQVTADLPDVLHNLDENGAQRRWERNC